VLPRIENPIPETIGLDFGFSLGGAASMLLLVVTTVLGFSEERRNIWSMRGMVGGYFLGMGVYLVALLGEVL
jgi:hypothetical protein